MTPYLLIEHQLKSLRSKGGCTGSSEPIPAKVPHRRKPHDMAHIILITRARVRVCVCALPNILYFTETSWSVHMANALSMHLLVSI